MGNEPSSNPEPNPNMNPNPTLEGEQDQNSHILVCLASLRHLSSSIRGGDHLREYLADALDTITKTIIEAQGALYNISSYKESRRKYYSDGLSYKDIKDLKITKDQLFSLFQDPSTGLVPPTSQAHISIDCIEQNIKANWMDRWYMVFDEDPQGNMDIPFNFLRNLYVEFILGKHVNYFNILDFQGVGHGMPQDREGARTDPNCVPHPPHTPKPPRLYPPAGLVIDETQDAIFHLVDTLLRHGTDVEGNVGQGVGTSRASTFGA